jgi:hypothetical protein
VERVKSAIRSLLSASKVDKALVESLLDVPLEENPGTPYWTYFLGRGKSPLSEVDFRQSLAAYGWLLALGFEVSKSPQRSRVGLDEYGPLVSLEPNPAIPPEGVTSYIYRCNGIRVSFSFTSRTDKLCQIVLRQDPQPARPSVAP